MPEHLSDRASAGSSWLAVGALAMGIALAIIGFLPAAMEEGLAGLVFAFLFLGGLALVALASGAAAYDMARLAARGPTAVGAALIIGAIAASAALLRPGSDLRWLTLYVLVLGLAWVALRRTAASAVFLVIASAGAVAWMATALMNTSVGI